MFGTVVEKLQDLLPKRFLLASFIPVLLFCCLNGLLLYSQDPGFREFADRFLLADDSAESTLRHDVLVFLALLITSFMFSMINTRLREILEGEHWPRALRRPFTRQQYAAMTFLMKEYEWADRQHTDISHAKASWDKLLGDARQHPPDHKPSTYSRRSRAGRRMARLERAMRSGQLMCKEDLDRAATELAKALEDADMNVPPTRATQLLDEHQGLFQDKIAPYALERLSEEINVLFNKRQFDFPDRLVAPTAMGNVARSIRSYAYSRYRMNIDVLWTRIQKVMQDEAYYSVLQDAKTQVDFLVSVIWLTIVSIGFWLTYLLWVGHGALLFLAIGIGGWIALVVLNELARQNYRAFADLVRSAIDLYRIPLLKDLRVSLPVDPLHERKIWPEIQKQLGYGEAVGLPYDHEA